MATNSPLISVLDFNVRALPAYLVVWQSRIESSRGRLERNGRVVMGEDFCKRWRVHGSNATLTQKSAKMLDPLHVAGTAPGNEPKSRASTLNPVPHPEAVSVVGLETCVVFLQILTVRDVPRSSALNEQGQRTPISIV